MNLIRSSHTGNIFQLIVIPVCVLYPFVSTFIVAIFHNCTVCAIKAPLLSTPAFFSINFVRFGNHHDQNFVLASLKRYKATATATPNNICFYLRE